MQNFTTWLVDARKSRNLSQAELARKVGVSIRTVSRLETGGQPNRNNLRKIAEVLGIFPDLLLQVVFNKKGQLPPVKPDAFELILPPLLSHRIRRLADRVGQNPAEWIERLVDLAEQQQSLMIPSSNRRAAEIIHAIPTPTPHAGATAAHPAYRAPAKAPAGPGRKR